APARGFSARVAQACENVVHGARRMVGLESPRFVQADLTSELRRTAAWVAVLAGGLAVALIALEGLNISDATPRAITAVTSVGCHGDPKTSPGRLVPWGLPWRGSVVLRRFFGSSIEFRAPTGEAKVGGEGRGWNKGRRGVRERTPPVVIIDAP